MTQIVLDRAKIDALRAGGSGKKRGVHPVTIRDFIKSGDPIASLNEHPSYSMFTAEDLKKKVQGLKGAYDKLKLLNNANGIEVPTVEVIFDDEDGTLYLINVDAADSMDADDE